MRAGIVSGGIESSLFLSSNYTPYVSITIGAYLAEVEEAVRHLFQALMSDTAEIERLRQTLGYQQSEAQEWHKAAMTIGGPFSDDADPQRDWAKAVRNYQAAEKTEEELRQRMAARAMSRGALAGAILQIAKQGLSLVFGPKSLVPGGRTVGSQPLREVVWEGRNHALHWEEGNPKAPVIMCLDALNTDFGNCVANYRTANTSVEIVQLLGWTSFENLASDLQTFEGPDA